MAHLHHASVTFLEPVRTEISKTYRADDANMLISLEGSREVLRTANEEEEHGWVLVYCMLALLL